MRQNGKKRFHTLRPDVAGRYSLTNMRFLLPASRPRFVRRFRWGALSGCALLLVACADAPTGPGLLEGIAGDPAWSRLLPPKSMPEPSAWVGASARVETRARVLGLERDAATALGRGDLARYAALRAEAAEVVIASLGAEPSQALVARSLHSLDAWLIQVGADAPAAGPDDEWVGQVLRARDAAAWLLERGDSARVAPLLIAAAEQVRGRSPELACARLIRELSARLAERGGEDPDAARAAHLLSSASEALRSGEVVRAARRAMYAGQLLEGRRVDDPFPGSAAQGGALETLRLR